MTYSERDREVTFANTYATFLIKFLSWFLSDCHIGYCHIAYQLLTKTKGDCYSLSNNTNLFASMVVLGLQIKDVNTYSQYT